jgi:SAM-dependent methyltransferase
MTLLYTVPRLVRRFAPRGIVRLLLRHGILGSGPGTGAETLNHEAAAGRYLDTLAEFERSIVDMKILLFGYGGSFGVACALLEAGATHVILCDRFASPDERRNIGLLPRYARYLVQDDTVTPRPEYMTIIQDDIRAVTAHAGVVSVDLVLSRSVFEHLDDVEGTTESLVRLTKPAGMHVHFIDLRDHFFTYPFEMLCYSEPFWRRWLNPDSNLNRYRLPDYRRVFEQRFAKVDINAIRSDPDGFAIAKRRIRPEFLTGDDQIDAVTVIRVVGHVA